MKYCLADNIDQALQNLQAPIKAGISDMQIAETLFFLSQQKFSSLQLAQITGIKDYKIRHYIRIARKLVPEVKLLLYKGKITFSMARVLASIKDEEQEDQARKALRLGTSVQRFRDKVKKGPEFENQKDKEYFTSLAAKLSEQAGFPIKIIPDKNNKNSGIFSIQFSDLTGFDAICHRMKLNIEDL
ncbi:hypothetical protein [Pelagibaculum spongiae]|uniref:ParB/Spo0J HTH domain-containing protein n=1 Tax=Pelagibaculum spongiae TaxID=2080658 RepID=A0A2V1GPA0_9GAMM|nr:hypothetical protein [Pelagibaculum spongiae]PVZ64457.1 hypothetical protein DC094_19260 [Pelagibaculum spongiae]